MNGLSNRQWRVERYPATGEAIDSNHFSWHEAVVPVADDNEFLVRTLCLAPGPAQRGYLTGDGGQFFGSRLPLGSVMQGRGIGVVTESRHPDYAPGDIFVGSLGWQDYSVHRPLGKDFVFSTRKIAQPTHPLSLHLGILGQAGGTAYFGLTDAAAIRPGDTVLITAAAGGVGSAAGQIARACGARTVAGTTGSDAKCAWLRAELGFDAAINYRTEAVGERLATIFPDGIDVVFDNVGGPVLDIALQHLARHARVALAGFIATQYAAAPQPGPAHYSNLIFQRARMQGFVYFDYWDRYAEAEAQLSSWHAEGKLQSAECIYTGLESMPAALADLFSGGNRGISICRVAPDP